MCYNETGSGARSIGTEETYGASARETHGAAARGNAMGNARGIGIRNSGS